MDPLDTRSRLAFLLECLGAAVVGVLLYLGILAVFSLARVS